MQNIMQYHYGGISLVETLMAIVRVLLKSDVVPLTGQVDIGCSTTPRAFQ